jgi:hypothetical protein
VAKQFDDFACEFLYFVKIEAIKFTNKIVIVLLYMHIFFITYFFKTDKVSFVKDLIVFYVWFSQNDDISIKNLNITKVLL